MGWTSGFLEITETSSGDVSDICSNFENGMAIKERPLKILNLLYASPKTKRHFEDIRGKNNIAKMNPHFSLHKI